MGIICQNKKFKERMDDEYMKETKNDLGKLVIVIYVLDVVGNRCWRKMIPPLMAYLNKEGKKRGNIVYMQKIGKIRIELEN